MKTVLNVKTDVDIKERAQKLAKHLGIPLSTIVNAHLKAFVNSGEFRVVREAEVRPDVWKEIQEQVAEARAGKNLSPAFSSVEEMKAWMDKTA